MNEIVSFDPFLALFQSYEGHEVKVTFTCPFCGCHSCRRSIYDTPSNHFFQGHFRCLRCNAGSFNKEPFYYASDVFIIQRDEFKQLTLF